MSTLSTVTIKDRCIIGNGAFTGCTNLTSIILDKNVDLNDNFDSLFDFDDTQTFYVYAGSDIAQLIENHKADIGYTYGIEYIPPYIKL